MSLLEVPGIKDDYSHYRTVYFLQEKSDTIHKLKHFIKFCKTFTGNSVKTIRTEFVNRKTAKLFEEEGIIHEKSATYTSE
jgi:Integrase core domain.